VKARACFASISLACSFAFSANAQAPDATISKKACYDAHVEAQEARQSGRMIEARSKLLICGSPSCPERVQDDCVQWASQLARSIPSVVLEAEDEDGTIFEVAVSMDGKPFASQLDGKAIELDPGLHTFVFRYKDRPPFEQRVIVREGERSKLVHASFAIAKPNQPGGVVRGPTPQTPIVPTHRPIPTSVYIAGGAAALGLATFVVMGAWGKSENSNLSESCRPFCSDSDVNGVKTKLIVADIGLGVSVVALAVGAVLFFGRPEVPLSTAKAFRFNVAPTEVGTGGRISWGGTF
jgi:hypothetical protein